MARQRRATVAARGGAAGAVAEVGVTVAKVSSAGKGCTAGCVAAGVRATAASIPTRGCTAGGAPYAAIASSKVK